MGSIYSFSDALSFLRRRFWVIAAVSLLGALVSLGLALRQEQVYSSSEVLQISQPTIAGDLAKSTVEGSSARRMQLIQQRLMARSTLLEVADVLGLFADQPEMLAQEIVQAMRHAVTITGTAAARQGYSDDGTISVLTITAQMPTPEAAQALAQEFSRRTIELSLSDRIERARETLAFFTEKEAALVRDVSELAEEVAQYRQTMQVPLAGTLQMRGYEIADINESLLELARQEIELKRTMAEAEATQREAYARRVRTEQEAALATVAAQQALLQERRAALEASLELPPEVERQMGQYERRQEQMTSELELITARRSEAEVGFRLETARQGERLIVIEAAPLPDYAIGGGRKSAALKGGVVSVALALAFAFLLDLLHPVLRSPAQMQKVTGLSPVVSIPVLRTRRRRGLAAILRRSA